MATRNGSRWWWLVLAAAAVVAIAACGGGGGGGKAASKPQWIARHGAAIVAVNTQLQFARSALDKGDRQAILSACNLLRDDLADARKALPVPEPAVDSALRQGLDAIATGVSDCLRGAQLASVANITERAMAELGAAGARMDAANQAIASWH